MWLVLEMNISGTQQMKDPRQNLYSLYLSRRSKNGGYVINMFWETKLDFEGINLKKQLKKLWRNIP